jgi:lipid II:glycine glycyltransferase (peptidoglycan interpeptide bridge formation enzyme)
VAVVNEPARLKELYTFQKNTLGRKGKNLPYTLKYLQRIMDACMAHNATALWIAKDNKNTIQAIVWEVWDEYCSYYFMGGQNPDTNSYRAMSLLLWNMIRAAKARGNKVFDLEGSMDEGVERFFRNFGGDRALYMVLTKNKSIRWQLKQAIFK